MVDKIIKYLEDEVALHNEMLTWAIRENLPDERKTSWASSATTLEQVLDDIKVMVKR